jgi:WXXGXW repeat (2 copies)
MKKLVGIAVLSAVTMGLGPGAALAGVRVYVRVGPPRAVVEVRPAAPGPRYVWVAGYHRWDGAAYVWVPGRWVVPPPHRRVWVTGHWAHRPRHGWYWVDGRWRR